MADTEPSLPLRRHLIANAVVLAEVKARDERDSSRAHAPLVPAPDAYVLETSSMTREEALAAAIRFVDGKRR